MTRDDLVELLRQYHDAAVDEGIAIAKGSPSALADANAGRSSARAAVLAAFDEANKFVQRVRELCDQENGSLLDAGWVTTAEVRRALSDDGARACAGND